MTHLKGKLCFFVIPITVLFDTGLGFYLEQILNFLFELEVFNYLFEALFQLFWIFLHCTITPLRGQFSFPTLLLCCALMLVLHVNFQFPPIPLKNTYFGPKTTAGAGKYQL